MQAVPQESRMPGEQALRALELLLAHEVLQTILCRTAWLPQGELLLLQLPTHTDPLLLHHEQKAVQTHVCVCYNSFSVTGYREELQVLGNKPTQIIK